MSASADTPSVHAPSEHRPTTEVEPEFGICMASLARRLLSFPCFHGEIGSVKQKKRQARHHPGRKNIAKSLTASSRSSVCIGCQTFLFEAKQHLTHGASHRQPKSRHDTLGLFGWRCPPSSRHHRSAVRWTLARPFGVHSLSVTGTVTVGVRP
jgi:hypothetical protein